MTKFVAAVSFVALSLALSAAPAAADEDAKAALCAEAQQRYQELEIAKPKGDGVAVVLAYKYNFCPGHLTVKKGTTVHFVNVDKRTSHSVWFKEAGQPESDRFFPEEGFSMPMLTEGEFPYLCGPHGTQEGMTGRITVTP
jgi:plastocyanin